LKESTKEERATSVEKFGVEHIPEEARHGSPGRIFTLWFAANLTIADYVIGVLSTVAFGLTVIQTIPILLIGNILGGLLLALSAGMGPKLGFPQMFSSRAVFGRRGNYVLGGLNWISTVGWFAVNTILGAEAVQVIAKDVNFFVVSVILVAVQILIAIYGHDFIHLFEKWMSIILGILWAGIFVLTTFHFNQALSYIPPANGSSIEANMGVALAASFSYIMSWSPYASDYSRYLPSISSRRRVIIFALLGGAIASFGVEAIGALVGSLTKNLDYFGSLYSFAGVFGIFAIGAVVLGAIAANSLNIYTNSLSALVLDIRVKRWITVIAGGIIGLGITLIGGAHFESFFENFLLTLDYWITPWLAIILVDIFLLRRTTVDSVLHAKSYGWSALGIYGLSILVSVPFMAPALTIPPPLNLFIGGLNGWFGGADFSYYISFVAAAILYFGYRKLASSPKSLDSLTSSKNI
jgi:NCS1 family nucleobase:cation symporter-1